MAFTVKAQDSNSQLAEFAKAQREAAEERAKMQAELDTLKADNERLKAARGTGKLTCKVAEKGGLSVYGLGRFPVTLYKGQWQRLLSAAAVAQIAQALRDFDGQLASKD